MGFFLQTFKNREEFEGVMGEKGKKGKREKGEKRENRSKKERNYPYLFPCFIYIGPYDRKKVRKKLIYPGGHNIKPCMNLVNSNCNAIIP